MQKVAHSGVVADDSFGQPVARESNIVAAAHRFAADAIVSPVEEFTRLLTEFLQTLTVQLENDHALVLSVAADPQLAASASTDAAFDEALWGQVEACFASPETDPVIVLNDTLLQQSTVDPAFVEQLQRSGVRSVLLRALVGRGDLRGVLVLGRGQSVGNWSESTIRALAQVSDVIGSMLAHRRTEQMLEGALRRNRRLSQQLVEIQEQERRRLAQELHDETGQYLAALKSDASLVGRRLPPGDDILRRSAEAVVSTADHIYEVVYGVMGRLCAVDLDDLGLSGALQACLINSGLENNGVTCELRTFGELDSLDDTISMTVYRIVQESLTNISKYAQATKVQIRVERAVRTLEDRRSRYRDSSASGAGSTAAEHIHIDTLEISISDNGCGFSDDNTVKGGGFGIRGMRERLQALGGSLTIKSAPGEGTEVLGVLPLGTSPEKNSDDA